MFSSIAMGYAADEFERPPVEYSRGIPNNVISRLQSKINGGQQKLSFDPEHGYLRDVLRALEVPVESQTFVFSKTSLQTRYISPKTPRAVYFNDEVYVGYCQKGEVLEIAASDPTLGTVFYTLDQTADSNPEFTRRVDSCLVCHSTAKTGGVPGHLVRSLWVDGDGYPKLAAGSRFVDHTTPLEERWGGWYVTGTHGPQSHRGNLVVPDRENLNSMDNSSGQNVESLKGRFDVDRYLSPHSDIVALMILEHQTLVQNRMTQVNFTVQQALYDDAAMQRDFGKNDGKLLASTTRRIHSACDELVDALLMVGEARLTSPVRGTSEFSKQFARRGKRDHRGRSLRELDLSTRLFRYPCSYLIDSETFKKLPRPASEYLWKRLKEIFFGNDLSTKYSHIAPEDRAAIVVILLETNTSASEFWRSPATK